jgi:hypothetical protein
MNGVFACDFWSAATAISSEELLRSDSIAIDRVNPCDRPPQGGGRRGQPVTAPDHGGLKIQTGEATWHRPRPIPTRRRL